MKRILLALLLSLPAPLIHADDEELPSSNILWYKQPGLVEPVTYPWAKSVSQPGNIPAKPEDKSAGPPWASQSLPLGNGRVGGTIFGGDSLERINLNEVSFWSGGPNLPGNGSGYTYGPTAGKDDFGSYQPFGNLYIKFALPEGKKKDYRRSLNLRDAIARSSFTINGVKHQRECLVSKPDDLLVYHATASKEGSVSARIFLTPCHTVTFSKEGVDTLVMSGTLTNGERFEGRVQVKAEGGKISLRGKGQEVKVTYEDKGSGPRPVFKTTGIPYLEVRDADSFTVYVSLATDYKMSYEDNWKGTAPAPKNTKILAAASKRSYKAIRKDHIKDYQSLFRRLGIYLGDSDTETAAMPTDERLAAYRNSSSPHDPELEATIYQFGRYMLIAGSRPGNLPLTLQGIWNDQVSAPWACDYHNNINLQMCYWGAEVGNLSECHMTFIDFMRAMEEPLEDMTKKQFGENIKGWTTRISQNPWGGGGWVMWNPPVNAWYALHVWDHYLFTHDKNYLKKTGYPLLRNICAFWETRLKKLGSKGQGLLSDNKPLTADKHPELAKLKAGTLVSPEGWSHEWGPVEDGCMHDQQLISELFLNSAEAAHALGVDEAWAKNISNMRKKLAENRVAKGGYLQEWIVDKPNMVSGHRHTSHLIGVFPGSSITLAHTPKLAEAAAKSLELRGLSADNRRSWTWPWRTGLWARLGEPEKAHTMIDHYIRYNLLDNLFGNHPPMQLDGTYGITGGMSEMLIQSHGGQIALLPALPKAWPNGRVKGIRARGNITVDMTWKDGEVTEYSLTTTTPNPKPVKVIVNGDEKQVTPKVVSAKE